MKYQRISDTIRQRIRTGVYATKVPGERALAAEFQVNFKTANHAVSTLVEDGLLIRKRGEGTFIAHRHDRGTLNLTLVLMKSKPPQDDPVFTRFFIGASEAAKAEKCRLGVSFLKPLPEDLDADSTVALRGGYARLYDDILAQNPDGILFLGNLNIPLIEELLKGRPGIVVGHAGGDLPFDSVRRDIRTGTADAVKHLARKGHRRIAHVTFDYGKYETDIEEKIAGYEDAIAELGLSFRNVIRLPFPPQEKTLETILALNPRPTAIVAAESVVVRSMMNFNHLFHVRIPENLAVVTFDDSNFCEETQPPISSVQAFGEELAQVAVKMLLARIDGAVSGEINEVIPCAFFERESSRAQITVR